MASLGESWSCLLEAAGTFVVVLAARRSWFCCRQLVAVLLEFGRRRAGLAEKGRAGPDVFVAARMRVLRHAASRLGAGRAGPGRVCRWAVGG